MKSLLIVNVGSAPQNQLEKYGDFELWAQEAIGTTPLPIRFHDGIHGLFPPYDELAGMIIMGSLSMVTEQTAWMTSLSQHIRALHQQHIPMLGICFGHQLIAHALGGKVDLNPQGLELGTVEISKHPEHDPLFSSLPDTFPAQAIHYQSVLTLPVGAHRLAASKIDPHHAFRVGDNTWGVQFHPEFSVAIMNDMIADLNTQLGDKLCSDLQTKTCQTPLATSILPRFAKHCLDNVLTQEQA